MNLELFFSPLEEGKLSLKTAESIFEMSNVFIEKMPNWKEASVILFSIDENVADAYKIREQLYQLKPSTNPFTIIDLGLLRAGPTREETINRLKEICAFFYEHKKPVILLCDDQEYTVGQFRGYEGYEGLLSMLNIDAVIDMEPLGEGKATFLNDIILHDPNYLFNYVQLGYQSYLNGPQQLGHMEKLNFELVRLGALKENIAKTEPLIRATNFTSFDLSALKVQDSPGSSNPRPFGLTGEEACQLCWYAGTNEEMLSLGLYNFILKQDTFGQTAFIIATMIWYFADGVMHRKKRKSFNSADFTKYVVALSSKPEELVFYKQRATEKWWMEIAYRDKQLKKEKLFHVPCSYDDYKKANENEVPDLWIKTLGKLV